MEKQKECHHLDRWGDVFRLLVDVESKGNYEVVLGCDHYIHII